MGFQQALSGLNGASKSLEAIGNNVANTGTVGFKAANTQFGDVYAAALSGGGSGQVGIGVSVSKIAQVFTQGNVTTSNNPLDIAVNGSGMFRMNNNGTISYTRNGQLFLDKDGYIVNAAGYQLTGYTADQTTGAIVPGSFVALQMNNTAIPPNATTASQVQVNLDSRELPPASMTHGYITGAKNLTAYLTPAAINAAALNNKFDITLDGLGPITITIPDGSYTTENIAQAIETAINDTIGIKGTGAAVDVELNTTSKLVITSRSVGTIGSQGTGSTVTLAATTGNTGYANLFTVVAPATLPTPVSGKDVFNTTDTTSYTASTSQTVYDSLGNPHSMSMYFVKTSKPNSWQMYTTIDNTAVPTQGLATGNTIVGTLPSTLTVAATVQTAGGGAPAAAGNDQFAIKIDGYPALPSGPVTVTVPAAVYGSATALATATQTAINAAFTGTGHSVKVTLDATGQMVVTSDAYGEGSTIELSAVTNELNSTAPPSVPATNTGYANLFGTAPALTPGVAAVQEDLTFNTSGALISPTTTIAQSFILSNGAASPMAFTLSLAGSTQYGITFGANQLIQDGYTSGKVTGMNVSPNGIVQGRYSNGKTRNMGQLVMVTFNNSTGLQSLGGNQWAESSESGQPIIGTPGSGSLGVVQSGAIEESNVDLTAELVNMITQQRVYQANAQTIKTQDQILQTLVNLR